MPENANLSSDSSEKFWLEIRDSPKGQISSKCRIREVEDQKGEQGKKGPGFLLELLLIKFWQDGSLGQNKHKWWLVVFSNNSPEGPQRFWQLAVQTILLVLEADATLQGSEEEVTE